MISRLCQFIIFFIIILGSVSAQAQTAKLEKALFAGGCFWCMEPPFEKLDGVHSVVSGYTDGQKVSPTYLQVSSGRTGHTEAVLIEYDPTKISYQKLLDTFWRQINPTDGEGQFVDRGLQYRTGIYFFNPAQKELALKSKQNLDQSGRFKKAIVTEIKPAGAFYEAEDYHQDYYKKNPIKYKFYRYRSGRDQFLKKTWAKDAN